LELFAIGFRCALALARHMSQQNAFRTVIDLTHSLNDRSPNWEGTQESPFQATELGNLERDGYYSRLFSTQEHYGTHFGAGVWTVEQIPADRLVRPVVVLDVREQSKRDADYEVSPQDIAAWEEAHGEIPHGAVVLAYTGWDEYWNLQAKYRNERGDGLTHYPGFSMQAVQFLIEERGVVGLGIDTMSVEIGATTTYPVHQFTAKQGVYHLENLTNLGLVPPVGATVVVAPLKLENGSGAPARVLALVR